MHTSPTQTFSFSLAAISLRQTEGLANAKRRILALIQWLIKELSVTRGEFTLGSKAKRIKVMGSGGSRISVAGRFQNSKLPVMAIVHPCPKRRELCLPLTLLSRASWTAWRSLCTATTILLHDSSMSQRGKGRHGTEEKETCITWLAVPNRSICARARTKICISNLICQKHSFFFADGICQKLPRIDGTWSRVVRHLAVFMPPTCRLEPARSCLSRRPSTSTEAGS